MVITHLVKLSINSSISLAEKKARCVDKIADLTGMEAVNGFKTSIPDEEIALKSWIGGTLRCGIYPKKGDPYNKYCRYREKVGLSSIYNRGNLCVSSWPLIKFLLLMKTKKSDNCGNRKANLRY